MASTTGLGRYRLAVRRHRMRAGLPALIGGAGATGNDRVGSTRRRLEPCLPGRGPLASARRALRQAVRRLGEWRSCFPAQAPGVPPQLAAAGGATLAPVVQTGLDKLDDEAALDAWLRARGASELWAQPTVCVHAARLHAAGVPGF